jgi:phosphoribosylaminoimidazole carboxylase (NCAIR synthetase)
MKKKETLKRHRGKNYYTSLSKTLKKHGKIDSEFEWRLSQITIEDLIALKLELSARSFGGKLYGYPLMKNVGNIVRESIIKFALSVTPSKSEASDLLGCAPDELNMYIKKYHLKEFCEGIIRARGESK